MMGTLRVLCIINHVAIWGITGVTDGTLHNVVNTQIYSYNIEAITPYMQKEIE